VGFIYHEVRVVTGAEGLQGGKVRHSPAHGIKRLYHQEDLSFGLAEAFFGLIPVVVGEAPGRGPTKPNPLADRSVHFPVKEDGIAALRYTSPEGEVSGKAAREKEGGFVGLSPEGLCGGFYGMESRMIPAQVAGCGGPSPELTRRFCEDFGDHPFVHQAQVVVGSEVGGPFR